MRGVIGLALLLTACGGNAPANEVAAVETNSGAVCTAALPLTAADGTKVFSKYYAALHPKALILLFHQAGSSKDEYATIAPRLVKAGYAALAIDQRSGGELFGKNETVAANGAAMKLPESAGYLAAEQDMQAALDWYGKTDLPVILWGSSYSSSLVFKLAADNPGKIKALLAFSPGEYFDDKTLVRTAAAKVDVPVYVTSAPQEAGEARPILDAAKSDDKIQDVPKAGVHGSSTLIPARSPAAEANWQPVLAFLRRVAP